MGILSLIIQMGPEGNHEYTYKKETEGPCFAHRTGKDNKIIEAEQE